MSFRKLHSGQGTPHVEGKTRAWVGSLDLTDGSATLDYEAELPGLRGNFREEPTILVSGPNGDEAVDSKGTSQATLTGTGDATVEVQVFENHTGLYS